MAAEGFDFALESVPYCGHRFIVTQRLLARLCSDSCKMSIVWTLINQFLVKSV
jgi:hypothetical protein